MKNWTVSPSPHLHCGETTSSVMMSVLIALLPAAAMSAILFGQRTLLLIGISVVSCMVFEYLSRRIMKRENTLHDLSAAVTGVLLAFCLPSNVPWWLPIIGAFAAIVVAKQFFGGIGQNFVNPAIVGRIVLMVSFPQYLSMKYWPNAGVLLGHTDAVTSATTLGMISDGSIPTFSEMLSGKIADVTPIDMLLGFRSGCLGETCAAALLLGGIYLVVRRVISPVIPLVFMGTTAALTWAFGQNPYYELLSGGLVLGAVFMATDYTTCPINTKGKIIYAVGCGLITALIRQFGNMPEGVSIAILLMNILVPHIERLTTPKPFGSERTHRLFRKEAAK